VTFRQPAETIEEAIGAYRDDQKNARGRSLNPFFWLAFGAESIVEAFIQIIGWIAEIPIRLIIRIFRLEDTAVRSWYGRSLTGVSAFTLWIFAFIQTLRALGLLGWWDSLPQSITHH
jgi:fumarate reductase subunit D